MTAPGRGAPDIVTTVASSAPALAARAHKKSEFLRGVAVRVSEHEPSHNDGAQNVHHSPKANEGRDHEVAINPPVRGYLHWSLLESLEGTAGYIPRFSLAAVDHTTFVRAHEPDFDAHEAVAGDSAPGHR